jgi:hypothetical protein
MSSEEREPKLSKSSTQTDPDPRNPPKIVRKKNPKNGGPRKKDSDTKRNNWIVNNIKRKQKHKPCLKENKEIERQLIDKENSLRKIQLEEKLLGVSGEISIARGK